MRVIIIMALRYRTNKTYRNSYTYRGFNVAWSQSTPASPTYTKESPSSATWTKENKPGGA